MSKRAFIFDMDGVIIDSERVWSEYENDFLDNLLGKEINEKIGDTVGVAVGSIYEKARELGFKMSKEAFQNAYDTIAFTVYENAQISPGAEELVSFLMANKFRLGLFSSSSRSWIDLVLPRLVFSNDIDSILSLNESTDLKPKPAPDGYIEMMKRLGATPQTTIILEDSNTGIKAAQASGAFTIAYSENLVEGYQQIEGDAQAKSMKEVVDIVKSRL